MSRPDTFTIPAALAPYARAVRLPGGPRLHYYEAGDPDTPPLLLVHGLGDEADTWRHVVAPLAARHRVIAPDLPGFGRSDRPRVAYTLAFFARTLAGLLGALGVERATLVGSSLGAAVVQRLALARPALAERLVLVGGALPVTPIRPPAALLLFLTPGLGELMYTGLRASQDAAYETLRPYYADLDALPAADRAFLRERVWARVWSAGQRRAYLSALRWLAVEAAFRARELRAQLAHLAVPTLLVWGERDHIAGRAAAEDMAGLLPDARLVTIACAGHLPHQERSEEFVGLF
ncbi:MAG TPA: alpha/beta fold hydrolase [Roseiflexaceae bacterium]|nr:alpha/beta fold hydrolase [Roseiflexaceae bacterium]